MKRLFTLTFVILSVFAVSAVAQDHGGSTPSKTEKHVTSKRGPIFRATKDQINQAQSLLKSRGFYAGEPIGKLDEATREGLRKYQQAEGIRITGTLNKITLEKMNITLTEKQKQM